MFWKLTAVLGAVLCLFDPQAKMFMLLYSTHICFIVIVRCLPIKAYNSTTFKTNFTCENSISEWEFNEKVFFGLGQYNVVLVKSKVNIFFLQ